MVEPWDRQSPPRLVGYESWLCQMPCIDNSGDVFVSVPSRRTLTYWVSYRTAG